MTNERVYQTKQMQPTVVRSYVRNVDSIKPEINEYQSADGIAKLTVLALAILLWQITLPVVLIAGAVYGATVIGRQPAPVREVIQPVPEIPIEKRSYNKRLTVNHYQLKKPVRV